MKRGCSGEWHWAAEWVLEGQSPVGGKGGGAQVSPLLGYWWGLHQRSGVPPEFIDFISWWKCKKMHTFLEG